ncbi:transposase family protein [Streptomyces qinglanensis]|uniref:transposase family protein n=1 Tax=Streptomyces qinglanensis TaxID=943816 RepID=UPI001EF867C3|nr:transposase family protein [Streptomyces qinglanensis]
MRACWFGVDRSTITRAIAEVQPLLAQRGSRRSSPHRRETGRPRPGGRRPRRSTGGRWWCRPRTRRRAARSAVPVKVRRVGRDVLHCRTVGQPDLSGDGAS